MLGIQFSCCSVDTLITKPTKSACGPVVPFCNHPSMWPLAYYTSFPSQQTTLSGQGLSCTYQDIITKTIVVLQTHHMVNAVTVIVAAMDTVDLILNVVISNMTSSRRRWCCKPKGTKACVTCSNASSASKMCSASWPSNRCCSLFFPLTPTCAKQTKVQQTANCTNCLCAVQWT